MTGDRPAGSRGLRAVLAAVAVLPALAVLPGLEDGRLVFLEYREPKLLVALVAATAFTVLFVGYHGLLETLRTLATTLRASPDLALLGMLLAYAVAGGAWVMVTENWWYELRQYALFFVLALLVRAQAGRDPGARPWLAGTICATTGLLVVVGVVQATGALPWLVPIDPGYGVRFPSLLGYKNPMALAVVGQMFLLPWLAVRAAGTSSGRRRALVLAGLGAAFVGECVYLAFLQSRTAYLSLALGLVLLALAGGRAWLRPAAPAGRLRLLPLAALVAVAALALTFTLSGDLRSRLASVKNDYVDGAARSDRATYLLNSLAMVGEHPLGVGLGDWQTQYPVHRRVNPGVAFSETVQTRRAHDDHAQLLAELGVPGFVLWLAFWAALLGGLFLRHGTEDRLDRRLLGVQGAVLLAAMAGDYMLEHPYLKLQFFLFLALVPAREIRAPAPGRRASRTVVALLVALLAATAWEAWQGARRLRDAGLVRYHHARWVELRGAGAEARGAELGAVLQAGERFVHGHGHTKAYFKDYLVLADAARATGRPALANQLAWESLRLHPYDSQAFGLLARIWAPVDPVAARELLRAQRYILDGPARGFRFPYPSRRVYPANRPAPRGSG